MVVEFARFTVKPNTAAFSPTYFTIKYLSFFFRLIAPELEIAQPNHPAPI